VIRFGRAKHYSEVTLDDHLKHLVWTFAHGSRNDEEREKPILSTNEVTREIVEDELIVPIITIKVDGVGAYGTAWYLHRDRVIFAIALWHNGRWTSAGRIADLPSPTIFASLAKILGKPDVRFKRDVASSERAFRIN